MFNRFLAAKLEPGQMGVASEDGSNHSLAVGGTSSKKSQDSHRDKLSGTWKGAENNLEM